MPELPEVETIRRGLEREIVGRQITHAAPGRAKFRAAGPRPLRELAGQHVVAVARHGKFLLWDLSDGTFVVHLGMTGRILFAHPGEAEPRHTHLVLELDDGRLLRFVDPRRFGVLQLFRRGADPVAHLGLDALSPDFTWQALACQLQASRAPLKAFLLDQRRVAGVGNIYACEALWRSRLSPRREARHVAASRIALLHDAIVGVLRESLAQGGTSFNDYVNHLGEPGRYLPQLAVYAREGNPCPRCGDAVRRVAQGGRSTFYCGRCQR
ncbi:MAG: bifunctional DNA-formamidopyrimidine glycosylase/DNA-(apurinic or apyrimidinic site) lyase [Thermoplasmatota archaeon]